MGAEDDVGGLRQRLLPLIAALVELRAEMDLATAFHLAAALLDGKLDLERVEGCLGVEAHGLFGVLRRRIGRGASLPEHGGQPKCSEGRDLFGTEIMARHGIDDLALAETARGDQIGDGGPGARGLPEADIDRQAEEGWESRAGHQVEIQRVAVRVWGLRRLAGGLDGGPILRNCGHEGADGLGKAGAGLCRCKHGCRISRWWRRDASRTDNQCRDGIGPLGAEKVVGVASGIGHGQPGIDRERGPPRGLDPRVGVAIGFHVIVGDDNDVGLGEAGAQRLSDRQEVARVHRSYDGATCGKVQARTRGPALADQDRAGWLGQWRRLCAHQCEMPPLCAAREIALGTVGCDGLDAVQAAVAILQRDDKMAARVHTQTERRNLLGGKIGMIGQGWTGVAPDLRRAGCGFLCTGDGRVQIIVRRLGRHIRIGLGLR